MPRTATRTTDTALETRALKTLHVDVDDGVATITLNRPDRLNAFNLALAHELNDCWRALRLDDRVRAVVLTGAGDKAFCTGIDRTEAVPQPTARG